MKFNRYFLCLFSAVLPAANATAYEVWMGTHLMRSADASNLADWSMTAAQLEGFNVNRAPHDTDPASNNEYRTIFAQFTNAGNAMTEFARSQATRDPAKTDELAFPSIATRLTEIFNLESSFGYDLSIIMFYDERGTFQGTEYLYEWTDIEIQYLRDWLDTNGHSDIKLMWNVRNNSLRNQQLAADPVVDMVEIEASTTAFLANTNNQRTFFDWYWTNPATANKPIALQLPRVLPGDPLNQFQGTRRVAQSLAGTIGYGENGMRSDRLIFLPVTYNDNFDYLPETVSGGAAYTNALTSIALSLIEQRSLFEGRVRVPSVADADSTTRLFAPIVGSIVDQTVALDTSTGPLPFTVGDDATPVSSLTISVSSSNTNLVPTANIVLGGSGANRTVTVTPAPGQSGTAEIELWVGDGTLASPVAFTMTVLGSGLIPGTLYSQGPDCSIKHDPAIEKLTSPTVDVGARGSSPWIERCTVYVFQLPDLGAAPNPFQDATFTYDYIFKNATLRGHDLYGLGRRASSTVLTGDYYAETSTADPTDATRLQQTIMDDSTPLGLVSTSAGGNANLVSYLNAQYAGGAGAGDYVFLRINTRSPRTELNYATLTMSEGGVVTPVDTRPRISYQATSPAPTITSIPNQVLSLNIPTSALPFMIGDDATPAGSLTLTGTSSNPALVPNSNIVFGGSGANRTVTVTPVSNTLGTSDITVEVGDGTFTSDTTFSVTVEGVQEVVAGWDSWNSVSAPASTETAAGVTATATASAVGGTANWSNSDSSGDPGRGSSDDTTWGSFDGNGTPASSVTNVGVANLTATNAKTDAEVTFTITNNGATDIVLDAFHFDALAFRPKAPRTYSLTVLAGSDVTVGTVFTSGVPMNDNSTDAITHLGGALAGHDQHDQIDLDLTGLADSTLEVGGTVIFQLEFSNGVGDGAGGHHLFLDNVAVSGATVPLTGLENWRFLHFGTIDNSGVAADTFDANGDGESNLLEFATHQDPNAATLLSTPVAVNGATIDFGYTRSKAALADGVSFEVEWSDTLLPGSWSSVGVVEALDGEDSETQTIVASVPAGLPGPRFLHLQVGSP